MVSQWQIFIPYLKEYLTVLCTSSKAGCISNNFSAWTGITSDKEILSDIRGMAVELSELPVQHHFVPTKFNSAETAIIQQEINKMIKKGIIEKVSHEKHEIISNIFSIPKKDGTHRVILNLKEFNRNVSYHHFKMDSLNTILKLLDKDCFMASLDLKDAYYSIPIRKSDRKYLRFYWQDNLYQYTCLPNGLSSGPRKFTKIMKPALSTLHIRGHIVSGHLDDFYLQGKTQHDCSLNLIDTIKLFTQLGLLVHFDKCTFLPSQEIVILGFVINSKTMTVRLTPEKAQALQSECDTFLKKCKCSVKIRAVAQIIGKIIASFPGVLYGPLYYRNLERDKTSALAENKGDYDANVTLSEGSVVELKWWSRHVVNGFKPISHGDPSLIITTDASLQGWGGECENTRTGGFWSHVEAKEHINYLELLAAFLGLQTFARKKTNLHVRLMIDNTSAVSIINHMGTSHSVKCNALAKTVWEWCIERQIWISAAHIPGRDNFIADFESRRNERESEWMLDTTSLTRALHDLDFVPVIDLFASRINKQVEQYVSYRPDPHAAAVDAFTLTWTKLTFYAFPPFSLIPNVLSKIKNEKARGVCVLPKWPTQPWYAKTMEMLEKPPIHLKASNYLLRLPSHPEETHPLFKKLHLMVCLLSGKV